MLVKKRGAKCSAGQNVSYKMFYGTSVPLPGIASEQIQKLHLTGTTSKGIVLLTEFKVYLVFHEGNKVRGSLGGWPTPVLLLSLCTRWQA